MAKRKPKEATKFTKGLKARAAKIPFRDIEKNGVTYTFLSQFLQCREAARLAYVEGLTQSGVISPLEFGQLFHLGFESLAKGGSPSGINKITQNYVAMKRSKERLTPSEIAEIDRLRGLVNVMFPMYYEFWTSPMSNSNPIPRGVEFRDTTKCLAAEQSFEFMHTLPVSGRSIKLYGRFDEILRTADGIILQENKTKSQIDSDGLTAYLPFDLQTMLYCLAIRHYYEESPAGIIYNVVKRPGQRWNPDKETLVQHIDRVAKLVTEDPQEYFMRWNVSFGPNDLDTYVTNTLNPILEQVITWWDSIKDDPFNPFVTKDGTVNPHHFLNPEGLYTKYGKSNYFELLTRGSMYGLKRRTNDGGSEESRISKTKSRRGSAVRKQRTVRPKPKPTKRAPARSK